MQDEAASVRQAAVDLLGNHIGARRDLAMSYFDTLVSASRDTSTSVVLCPLKPASPHLQCSLLRGMDCRIVSVKVPCMVTL